MEQLQIQKKDLCSKKTLLEDSITSEAIPKGVTESARETAGEREFHASKPERPLTPSVHAETSLQGEEFF